MCLVQECIKFVVLTFNLIFVLVGAALITIGTIYKINFTAVTDVIPDPYSDLEWIPIITIVVGCIIFVIAFFGCCGAIRNSPCLLTTYAVILLAIFILQVALGVFAFLEIKDKNDFSKHVNQTVDKIFADYNKDSELVNTIQQELHCCGPKSPDYWNDNIYTNNTPISCYEDKKRASKNLYVEGCRGKVYNFLSDTARIIGIVVLALSATEVIGATLTLCLANSVRNELRRSGYY